MTSVRKPTLGKAAAAARLQRQIAKFQSRSKEQIATLSPEFARRVECVLQHLGEKGWKPVVYHGDRSTEEQVEKVKAGASKTMKSFHLEGTAVNKRKNGLYWTVKGEAADIVDARWLWEGPGKDLGHQFWKDLGAIAKVHALEWGGDWTDPPDPAHVQMVERLITQDSRGLRA